MCIKSKKDNGDLFKWCDEIQSIDNKNFCAVWRQCLKMPSFHSLDNATITIAVVRMCVRLKLHEKFEKKWKLLQLHIDRAAHRQLLSYKSQGLLLPADVVENVLAVNSCETGAVLFAKALCQI